MSTVFNARMGRFARVRMDLDAAFDRLFSFAQSTPVDDLQNAVNTAALRGGVMLRDEVRRIYKEGDSSHQKNHPWTVMLKGSNQPLRETGRLAQSVEVKVLTKSRGLVEVRIQLPPGEESMKANIAEQGMIIKVTPAMRRFLSSQGIDIKRSTQFLMVPARPVFPIAIKNMQKPIEQEIRRQLESMFGKVFGGSATVRVG